MRFTPRPRPCSTSSTWEVSNSIPGIQRLRSSTSLIGSQSISIPKKRHGKTFCRSPWCASKVCDEIGLNAFPKTSGSSGIHIYLPLKPTNEYAKVAEFSRLLASEIASRAPKIATVERSIEKRKHDQVYVDWMQNARGKSLASVFTARAKPGATVSMPLTWKQIEKGVRISDFTVKNVPALLNKNGNAWADFFAQRQKLKLK